MDSWYLQGMERTGNKDDVNPVLPGARCPPAGDQQQEIIIYLLGSSLVRKGSCIYQGLCVTITNKEPSFRIKNIIMERSSSGDKRPCLFHGRNRNCPQNEKATHRVRENIC